MADGDSSRGSLTSVTLLTRLRANEADAWERLVRLYRPLMVYWCGQFGLRGPDADDVIQDAFQIVTVKLTDFRRDRPGDTFRGWLRSIVRNQALNRLRKDSRLPPAEGGSDANRRLAGVPSPDDTDADPQVEMDSLTRRALELVRSEFEPKTWDMFVASATGQESTAAIAQRLAVTTATVRQAKARVLRRLRVELGELLD